MNKSNLIGFALMTVLAVTSLVVSGCAAPTPEKVVETVEVEKTVEIEREKEVTREVVLTPTPLPSTPTVEPSAMSNTLVAAHSESAWTFDPTYTNWWNIGRVTTLCYDPLVKYDPVGKRVLPWLAKEWEVSDDGLTYTFQLHEGVKFHDGTDLTASDVKFSMERLMAIGEAVAAYLSSVESIEVVDDYRLKVTLENPSSAFTTQLTQVHVISEEGVEAHEEEGDWAQAYLRDHELGSGPYALVEHVPEQKDVFGRFDQYWKGWTGDEIDRVNFLWVKESATQRLMLQRGDIDIMMEPSLEDLVELDADPEFRVLGATTPMVFAVGLRVNHEPLDDIRVRRALAMAFPYDRYIQVARLGYGQRARGPLGSAMAFHNDEIPLVPYDLERAKELLAEAGYPEGGFTLQVAYDTAFEYETRALEMIRANWADRLGIEIEPMGMDWPTITESQANPDSEPDVFLGVVWPDFPHPDGIRVFFHGDYMDIGSNSSWWDDPETNRLFDEALRETDPAKQEELYKELQRVIFDGYPAAWLCEMPYHIVARDYVKGYVYNPSPHQSLNVYEMRLEGKP